MTFALIALAWVGFVSLVLALGWATSPAWSARRRELLRTADRTRARLEKLLSSAPPWDSTPGPNAELKALAAHYRRAKADQERNREVDAWRERHELWLAQHADDFNNYEEKLARPAPQLETEAPPPDPEPNYVRPYPLPPGPLSPGLYNAYAAQQASQRVF